MTMRIIVGRIQQDERYFPPEGWLPHEIRKLMEDYRKLPVTIVTLNRTVLDMVTSADSKLCIIPYESVYIRKNTGEEIPLLSVMDEAYLSHFSLGDMFDRKSHEWGI